MDKTPATAKANEVLANLQRNKELGTAAAAKPGPERTGEVLFGEYRLPTAPGTVWFRDKDGQKYKRFYPDGIVRPENENEQRTMEDMVRVRNCYRHLPDAPVGEFQKPTAPIDPNQTN